MNGNLIASVFYDEMLRHWLKYHHITFMIREGPWAQHSDRYSFLRDD